MKRLQPKISKAAAERKLDAIQFGGIPMAMKLKNVPVTVEPEPGNAFRIRMDMSVPGAAAAAGFLNDVGADVRPWPCPADGDLRAVLTWDSALHYLVMPGELKYA